MAMVDTLPQESIVEYFFRVTADLSPAERQRVLDVICRAEQHRKARVAAADAIEKAKGK
jgi:hypothetical protein